MKFIFTKKMPLNKKKGLNIMEVFGERFKKECEFRKRGIQFYNLATFG